MKELGIMSLNIISDQSATLNSNEFRIIQIFLEDKSSRIALESSPMSSSTTKTTTHISKSLSSLLSAPAIKMAKNLHELLLYIDNLPTVPPTINSMNTDINSYTRKLLNKLSTLKKEEFEAEIENQDDKDFLKIHNLKNKQRQEEEEEEEEEFDFQSELNFPKIISEIDLLKHNDFDTIKENTIKTLVTYLIKVYDKFIEGQIETEINRRRTFRLYINFLMIYRKIEIYCCLNKVRNKGETIKNQANKKIVEYSSRKFEIQDISFIIRTGKRIERLISLSNREWGIVDAFPNLDINFFKSSISTAAYEIWLKLVETGYLMTEHEGRIIYNRKKKEENQQREANFLRMYDELDNRAISPRYFPDDNDE